MRKWNLSLYNQKLLGQGQFLDGCLSCPMARCLMQGARELQVWPSSQQCIRDHSFFPVGLLFYFLPYSNMKIFKPIKSKILFSEPTLRSKLKLFLIFTLSPAHSHLIFDVFH